MASVITITNIGGTPSEYNLYYDTTNEQINTEGAVSSSSFPYEIVVEPDNSAWSGNCITIRVESAENSKCSLTKTFCCSSTATGTVFKDEIYNARVFLKENSSMTYETANYKTTTDVTGSYTLNIPTSLSTAKIVATGGIDVKTGVQLGESYEFENTVDIAQGVSTVSAQMNIVTTIVSKFKESFPALSKGAALTKLGLQDVDIDSADPATTFLKTNAKLNTIGALLSNNSKENFTKFINSVAADIATKVNSNDTGTYQFIEDPSTGDSQSEVAVLMKSASASILNVSENTIQDSDASTVADMANTILNNIQDASDDNDVVKALKYVQTGGSDGTLQAKINAVLNPSTDTTTKTNSVQGLTSTSSTVDSLISDTFVVTYNPADPDANTMLDAVAGGSVTTTTTQATQPTSPTTSTQPAPQTTQATVPTTIPAPQTTNTTVSTTADPNAPQYTTTITTVTTQQFVSTTTTTAAPIYAGPSGTTTTMTDTVKYTSTTVTTSQYINYATTTTDSFVPSPSSSTSTSATTTATSSSATSFSTSMTTTADYIDTIATTTSSAVSSDVDTTSELTTSLINRYVQINTSDYEGDLSNGALYMITNVTPESSLGASDATVTVSDNNEFGYTLNESDRGGTWVLRKVQESPV